MWEPRPRGDGALDQVLNRAEGGAPTTCREVAPWWALPKNSFAADGWPESVEVARLVFGQRGLGLFAAEHGGGVGWQLLQVRHLQPI